MIMKPENERLNILNENQKKKMLDLILAEADGAEMIEKFVKTFSDAYDRVRFIGATSFFNFMEIL